MISGKTVFTYEYQNPLGNTRGVACIIALDTKTAYFYLEEESYPGSTEHKGAFGIGYTTADATLTGSLSRFGSGTDSSSPLPFSVNTANSGEKPWNIKIGSESQTWEPRTASGAANWQMSLDLLPRSCPSGMSQLNIISPIPRGTNDLPDRKGIVCYKATGGLIEFTSTGWRRLQSNGQMRKFVTFGNMHLHPDNRYLIGKVINMPFYATADEPNEKDRVPLDSEFRAVPSRLGHSVLLLGIFQEKWVQPALSDVDAAKEIYEV